MNIRWDQDLSDEQVGRVRDEIDCRGFARLDGFISTNELRPLQDIAERASDSAGGYAGLNGSSCFEGTVWHDLPRSATFQRLCLRLGALGMGRPIDVTHGHQVFRCLKGETGKSHSMYFHYDSYILSVLLPVAIPSHGERGNLLVFPSARPIRRTYIANLLDKLLSESKLSQAWFRHSAYRINTSVVSIPMVPGCAYFFWGYRSLHTNEPCDADKLRATALIHYGDPHNGSQIRKALRRK